MRFLGGSIILAGGDLSSFDFEVSHAYFGGNTVEEYCCLFEYQTYAAVPTAMKRETDVTMIVFDMVA